MCKNVGWLSVEKKCPRFHNKANILYNYLGVFINWDYECSLQRRGVNKQKYVDGKHLILSTC